MHLFHLLLRVEVRFLLPQPQWVSVSAQHTNHFLCLLAKPIRWLNQHSFATTIFFFLTHDVEKKCTRQSLHWFEFRDFFLFELFWWPCTERRLSDRQYIIYVSINGLCIKGAGCLSLSTAWKPHLSDKEAERFPHRCVMHNVGLRS